MTVVGPERAQIVAPGLRLALERRADEWVVLAPERTSAPPSRRQ